MFLNGRLDCFNRFLPGKYTADCEKTGLHYSVDPIAHARLARDLIGIHHIELNFSFDDCLLHVFRKMLPDGG